MACSSDWDAVSVVLVVGTEGKMCALEKKEHWHGKLTLDELSQPTFGAGCHFG